VSPNGLTASIDTHTQLVELAAELVEKTDASVDRLATLLTADVGHTDSEVVYEENKLELHRYEPAETDHGTPIVIVYALVNRPYILDLQPDRSVIRRLLEAGFEVYLVEWGEPSRLDTALSLSDYVCRYLHNCVEAVCDRSGVEDVHLLGYCMGGTLSIMYTALHQERVRTLGLMATPVAFDGTGGILERWASHYDPGVAVETYGNLPAELLAFEFSLMEPVENYVTKYVRLYENLEDESFVANFSRMEQWIWDGVDVAGETYREFVGEVYKQNALVENEVHLDGERIDLREITVPVLQIVGQYDHIVPAESSRPFNDAIASEDERLIEFPAGHIGISVSSNAHDRLWPEVCSWYADRSRDTTPTEEPTEPSTESRTESPAETDGSVTIESPTADVTPEDLVDEVSVEIPGDDAGDGSVTGDVRAIDGIGPTYAGRLHEAGIDTLSDLREHDPATLAEIAETSPTQTAQWLDQL
jgi:polyhydroxyalkanoate synthase